MTHPLVACVLGFLLLAGCLPLPTPLSPGTVASPSPSPIPTPGLTVARPSPTPTPTAVPDDPDFVPQSNVDYDLMSSWVSHPILLPESTTVGVNYTVYKPDANWGSQGSVPYNQSSDVDVFFVYSPELEEESPTNVALDKQDDEELIERVRTYGGQFVEFGRLFAPKYRFATLGTFTTSDASKQAWVLEKAATDVMAAFQHYLDHHNKGRKVILVGHEQGAVMLGLLLRKMADRHAFVRNKIHLAVLGGLDSVFAPPYAPKGQAKGGWWEVIPVCQFEQDTGCVLTWQVWKEGLELPGLAETSLVRNSALKDKGFLYQTWDASRDAVTHAALGFGEALTSSGLSVFPASVCDGCVPTPFVAYEDFFKVRWQVVDPERSALFIQRQFDAEESRPNPLLDEEKAVDFATVGYRQFGYLALLGTVLDRVRNRLP